MQNLPGLPGDISGVLFFLIGAFLIGVLFGVALSYLVARRRIAAAHIAGRTSRDAETAALCGQRDVALERANEFAARIERSEYARQQSEQNLRTLTAHAAAQKERAEQFVRELTDTRRDRDDTRTHLVDLTRQHAALEAGTRAQAQAAAEKLHLLEQAEQRLRETFQNLANKVLDDRAERFREQSVQHLGGLLDPLKVQLKEFRETITATHASEQRERGMLAQEIHTLKQLNQRISEDAINLTRALRGDTRAQGAWGELVLERVLEASGLQSGREYTTQASFDDGEGGRRRPDVIVHLPDDKDIVIDAKVSLVAYERFCAAPDDDARAVALAEHVASLRRHIDGLAQRDYSGIAGLRTLDFVLLFVPVEAAFIEAVRADDRLYTQALDKNISLVSPSTLLATLRTVAHLWRIERRNVNAMDIARRAAQLHDNFALLVGELETVGLQLDKAQRAQASALRRLTEGGKGSVLLQVQSLAEMGAPVKRKLALDRSGVLVSADADAADGEGDAVPAPSPASGRGER
jgi:DNA recombination protein RmuC